MKKLFVLFILILIPFVSKADDSGVCGENLTWVYDAGHSSLTISGTGDMYDYTSSTHAPWYKYRERIEQIIIENGVASIGNYAFYEGSSWLRTITIPNSVTTIGDYAFAESTGLIIVVMPSSITSIGKSAFNGCSSLEKVMLLAMTPPSAYDDTFSNFDISLYVPEASIDAYRTTMPWKNFKSYNLADYGGICGYRVLWTFVERTKTLTILGDGMMKNYQWPSDLPWHQNKLTVEKVVIEPGVTSIGNWAFSNCKALTSISIPDCVTSIGDGAFYYCSNIKSISIPDGIKTINSAVFMGCSKLTSITIPDGVTSIGYRSFEECGIKLIKIPDSVTTIGARAFYGCSQLSTINIPEGVTSIGSETFRHCKRLRSIIIPSKLTYIGKDAFYNSSLTSITIPNSVTSIGKSAFYNCSYLNEVKSEIDNPYDIENDVFSYISSDALLYVPVGTKGKYQAHEAWSKSFKEIIESSTEGQSTGNQEIKRTIHVTKAGTLPDYIPDSEKYTIEELTLTGELNGTDFRMLRDMAGCNYLGEYTGGKLKVLDFSGAKIVAGGEKYLDTNHINNIGGYSSGSYQYGVTNDNEVPQYVFFGCYLENTSISNYATRIGYLAFYSCAELTSISIPNSITKIDNKAFEFCNSLTSVTIPNSVTSIDWCAFCNCSSLTSVISEIQNPFQIDESVFSWISSNATLQVPKGTKSKYEAFSGWTKNFKEIIESSSGTDSQIISFADDNVKAICVANWDTNGDGELSEKEAAAVKDIGNVFRYNETITSFDELQYFTGVEAIPDNAFKGCSGLTSITIPNSVTSIGQFAFSGCNGLTSITIPNSVTNIIKWAFSGCSGLTSIMVSSGNTKYDSRNNCNAIIETSSNTLILGCMNTIIPNSVTNIGDEAFKNCNSLTSITIPNSVTSIGDYAFYNCSGLTHVTIGNSVTSIGNFAFYGCSGLTSITIPNSVISIGSNPFRSCNSLTSITVSGGNTKYDSRNNCNAIIETSSDSLITGCKNTTIPNSVKIIGDYAFEYCSGLTSITIPISVRSIGYAAFSGCSGLTSITIPNSVISIGYYAFSFCSGLTSITIPNSVTSIGAQAFWGCSGLTSITVSDGNTKYDSRNSCNAIIETSSNTLILGCMNTFIPNSVTSIGDEAFYKCGGLASITIPNSVTSIGAQAFWGCSGLTSITIPNSVTSIGDEAFRNCTSLASVTIGNSVMSIGQHAFRNCSGLTSITIPNSVTSIGGSAFNGCKSLTSITIPNSVTSIGGSAFVLCSKLQKVKSDIINPYNISSSVFSGISSDAILYVPTGTKEKYQAYEGWTKYFKEIIEYSTETTTYSLSITASGDGYASYNGITIRNNTQSFAVNEGTNATVTFTPDTGYRVASVKNNNIVISPSYANNGYTVYNITANTTLTVTFEAIPTTTYSLSITASGNGSVSYSNTAIRNNTQSFTVDEGTNATITFSPDNGYRLAGVWVNNYNVTNSVYNNQYTISNIRANTTLSVEFEAIPVTTYSLSISASGNGYVSYNGSAIRNRTTSFTLDEGTSATVIFAPDNGNSIASVKLNNSDITSQISGNSYTISNITANTALAVTFQEDVNALTVDGLNYTVTSQSNKTVTLTSGGTGLVLTVPATITQNGTTWKVTGIDNNALKGNTELAAIIWNPEAAFTATVTNPNLLLYVKLSDYAPAAIQNVIINGTASNIILTEAKSGNNFYCPQSFVAQKISFTHNYKMQTGIGEARGWETIALPFDVQTITHATKGEIKPFAQWKSGDAAKPFWLMELTGTGFVETGSIKAYTPYIISMPNNQQYDSQWLLNGKVTFAASGVTVGKTDQLQEVTYKDRTFIPCFVEKGAAEGFYALNVSNEYETNNSGMTDGSRFVLNMRKIHPFEAYMTTSSNAASYFDIFDDMTTGIQMMVDGNWTKEEVVYDLQGRKLNNPSKKGVYIINGKKKIIR